MPKQYTKKRNKKIVRADRVFMGMPVKDATSSMLVQPTKEDIEKSIKGDPENCAYANCVKRMLNTSVVFVYHTVAYIEVLDSKGHPTLERYVIKDGTKEYLEDIDNGETVAPAGFSLKAPPRSQTLDYKAEIRRLQRSKGKIAIWAENRRQKLRKEKETGRKLVRRKVVAQKTVGSFRDGTGCVRFIGTNSGLLKKHEF